MRFTSEFIRPIGFGRCAFNEARQFYAKHAALNFEDDLIKYLKEGFVYSSPTCFAMACVINLAPKDAVAVKPAWWIQCAVGDLSELLRALPGRFEYIVWCRNNEGGGMIKRKWKTDRLFKLASAVKGRQQKVMVS